MRRTRGEEANYTFESYGAGLDSAPDLAYRQRLSRARRDLHQFMDRKCGLVNPANPCRCARKTQAFINAGFVDPANLLFATAHVTRVRRLAPALHEDVNALFESIIEAPPLRSGQGPRERAPKGES